MILFLQGRLFFKGKLRNCLYHVLYKESSIHEEAMIEVYLRGFYRS